MIFHCTSTRFLMCFPLRAKVLEFFVTSYWILSKDIKASTLYVMCGRVAQRIRHLTTNQGIAGSNPAVVVTNLFHSNLDSSVNLKSQNCGSSCDKSLALSSNAVALFSCSHRFMGSYGDAQARDKWDQPSPWNKRDHLLIPLNSSSVQRSFSRPHFYFC